MGRRVIIVGPAYPLRGGGMATFNERLAYAFQEAGDEVEIVTFSLQYPSFLFPGKSQYSEEPAPEGLRIKVLINSVNPISWWRTGNYIRKQTPDLVIFRYWLPFMGPALGTIARIVRQNGGSRVLAITDNVVPHEQRPGDVPFTRYFLGACHGFITMSKAVQQDLKQFAPQKPSLYLFHPLYDNFGEAETKRAACKALHLDPRYNYILFFGFIRAYKGLDLLLQAMASPLLQERKDLKLIIAGEFYEDEAPYRQLINQLRLHDRLVLRTDFIPNAEVRHYFCAADLVVQPYKHATQSGVTQVAYHFNKPMVVTNVGGLAELVPDGEVGYVVTPEPEDIANAISRFYHADAAGNFSQNIATYKQRFSWAHFVRAIWDLASQV
ncbi:glycosyltransferase involved in cell wall biosynthesis [Pontibacter ummariensis]|uniref:Glycosyltransferase involved in cell wall bisynthesis n=1 Tax=Pontibacter ummariensis TaxID=1610492 RepID=A0A239F1K7_9BACT|nr:glycosyltransferase [Pontibacter ummariensis]PRY12636.1 glycosyltransferase involved in cell wall biosynthesis [Pontibacter ummariensis]SNS50769.1 Glycosyltransferase involved in cell wall bisynthesis [Pontibacter ummariensis]